MITDVTRRCELELEAAPFRLGQVRRIVQAQLRYWRLESLIDAAVLGITELLANVHKHAQPNKICTIGMATSSGSLTVSVRDADPRLPVMAAVNTEEMPSDQGWGLRIVAALSREWGADPHEEGGKTVWFTLGEENPAGAPLAAPESPAAVASAVLAVEASAPASPLRTAV